MKSSEAIKRIESGALDKYASLYGDRAADQPERYISAIRDFCRLYGEDRDITVISVSGRSEISGNHTDHNGGEVLCAAVNRDIIAIASPSENEHIRITSKGYSEDAFTLSEAGSPDNFKKFTSRAIIAGICRGLSDRGYEVGGFDAYTTSNVAKGSGLSSSAAFEVTVGCIISNLFNGGRIENKLLAIVGQYAENEYFGKPSGLMDQLACALGGFVYIDFEDPTDPIVEPIDFSIADRGYSLCIVNTGGSHANLNDDYASVPLEMKKIAAYFGRDKLRGITEEDIIGNAPVLRAAAGDRAILRAIHFVSENRRVEEQARALREGDIDSFLSLVLESGNSSFRFLQNVFSTISPNEQGISLAIAVAETALRGKKCAYRVHGGGFAGTMLAFIPNDLTASYTALMDSVFGEGATTVLTVRPEGAIRIEL